MQLEVVSLQLEVGWSWYRYRWKWWLIWYRYRWDGGGLDAAGGWGGADTDVAGGGGGAGMDTADGGRLIGGTHRYRISCGRRLLKWLRTTNGRWWGRRWHITFGCWLLFSDRCWFNCYRFCCRFRFAHSSPFSLPLFSSFFLLFLFLQLPSLNAILPASLTFQQLFFPFQLAYHP